MKFAANTQNSFTFNPFKRVFHVLGVDVFPFFGHDHVFLAAKELQVPAGVKPAHVTGHQPAVHNRFRGHLRLVQIARHDRFAAHGHFANSIGIRIDDAHFHAGQRLPDRVRAKGLQIVDRDRGSRFGQSIAVRHGNAQVVEELQRLRFREGSADDDRFQAPAKGRMDLFQQTPADRRDAAGSLSGLC